jgi:hypothetical protein
MHLGKLLLGLQLSAVVAVVQVDKRLAHLAAAAGEAAAAAFLNLVYMSTIQHR